MIPLFEEYNEENNKINLESLKGFEAASYFLKTYKIDDKSLFEIIEAKKNEDIDFFITELENKTKEIKEKNLDIISSQRIINDKYYFIDNEEEAEFHTEAVKIGEGSTSITYKVFDTRTNAPMCKKVLKYNKE